MKSLNNTIYKAKEHNKGHYESFFIRANHKKNPKAFWIRYTIFSPKDKNKNTIAELWAVVFNKQTNNHYSLKSEFPINESNFSNDSLNVNIDDSILNDKIAKGKIENSHNSIQWNLEIKCNNPELYLLPKKFYSISFPKAKSLVPKPLARFTGKIIINNNEELIIDNWIGSLNHNWGSKHTDKYAWGQIAGFDNNENTFLEIATAQIKLGLVYSPKINIAVIRHNKKEYFFNSLIRSVINSARYNYFTWTFELNNGNERLLGTIKSNKSDFVALNYYNPIGGNKTCLNTKIASADINLILKNGEKISLLTESRAAFEILTDDDSHGIKL